MKQIKLKLLTIAVTLVTQIIFAQSHTATNKVDSSAVLLKKLIGTWQLIEFSDIDSATGKWVYDYGLNPKGYFTYTKTGIVNINISVDTALRVTRDAAKNYTVNLQHWINNYSVGYFGTYSVDFNKSVLTHHVTGGAIPWYVDTDQQRPFSFHGDTLIIGDNKTWRRVLVKAD